MVEGTLAPLVGERIVLACAAVLNEFANPIGLPPENPSLVDWVQCIDEHLGASNRQPRGDSPFAEAAQEVEFRHTGKARLDHPRRSIGRIVPGLAHNACSALDLMLSKIRHFTRRPARRGPSIRSVRVSSRASGMA